MKRNEIKDTDTHTHWDGVSQLDNSHRTTHTEKIEWSLFLFLLADGQNLSKIPVLGSEHTAWHQNRHNTCISLANFGVCSRIRINYNTRAAALPLALALATENEYNERNDRMPHNILYLYKRHKTVSHTRVCTHTGSQSARETDEFTMRAHADNATRDNWLSQRIRHKWCSSCWKNKFYILLRFVFI